MEGPFVPSEGHRFDRERVLLDPTARAITWRPTWGHRNAHLATPRGRLIPEDFDWEDDRPLGLPLEDLVIYEMHVRGFQARLRAELCKVCQFLELGQITLEMTSHLLHRFDLGRGSHA